MELIGYTCSYIPVELLSATGFRPYRLLHGDRRLSRAAEALVGIDACPLVKSNLGFVLENKERFVALVGTTGCDMARRLFDIVASATTIPTFLLNNPRTDNPRIFYDEIDWLQGELEHLAHKQFNDPVIQREIERWEGFRAAVQVLEEKRKGDPSRISTTDFLKVVTGYHQGTIGAPVPSIEERTSSQPRVFLLGSPVPYEAGPILSMFEQQVRIVGDFNCGLSRFLTIRIAKKNLAGIKSAYYHQPPCIFKRPNRLFYDWVSSRLQDLRCAGIIAWTLDYCDNFEFELKKMEELFGLPLLRVRSDFSYQHLITLKTRIAAFCEMLSRHGKN